MIIALSYLRQAPHAQTRAAEHTRQYRACDTGQSGGRAVGAKRNTKANRVRTCPHGPHGCSVRWNLLEEARGPPSAYGRYGRAHDAQHTRCAAHTAAMLC